MKFPQSKLDFWALFSGEPWLFRSWRRFGIVILLSLVAPALALLLYTSRSVERRLEQRALQDLQVLGSVFAKQLSEEFLGRARYVESFASRPTFTRAVQNGDMATIRRQLQAMVESQEQTRRAVMTDTNGVLRCAYPEDPTVRGRSFSHRDWFRGVRDLQAPYVSEVYARSAFGNEEVVMIAMPVRGDDGTLYGYLGAQYLTTDLRAWFARVLAETPHEVIVADQHGNVLWDPQNMLATLKRSVKTEKSAAAGSSRPAFVHSGERHLMSKHVVQNLGWTIYTSLPERFALRSAREIRHVIIASFILFGSLLAVVAAVWLKTLFRYAEGLERSTRHLEYICYSVAHNFRAPLRAVAGFTELLQEKIAKNTDQEGRDYLARISQGGISLDRMISDLLLFGKISHWELKPQPVDVVQLLHEISEELALDQDCIVIQVEKPLGYVYADKDLLRHALKQLLSNAQKFSGEAHPPYVRVTTSVRPHNCLRVAVHDNGPGIAPQFQQQIFELFLKLDQSAPGTGVGLALAKNATERMGGSIGVDSTPGQGSTFWIEMPRR